MVECPLCKKTVKSLHKKSHLIPEWMYKDCYYDKHKLLYANTISKDIREKQKGFYDEIICCNCESESQTYDHYASLILHQKNSSVYKAINRTTKQIALKEEILNLSYWENIDFLKFQKFVFACVLRTHLSEKKSRRSLFAEKHFEGMREIYKNNSIIDDMTYPIVVFKLPDDDKYINRVDLSSSIKVLNHNVVDFYGAGYTFWVFVSKHKKPDFVQKLCLNHNGSLYLIYRYFEDTGKFKALIKSNFEKDFKNFRSKKDR